MPDLTPLLNELLKTHNTHSKHSPRKRSDTHDEFIKEAYRINDHIVSLHTYLLSIRQAYLSTSPPPHRHHAHPSTSKFPNKPPKDTTYLSNPDRDAIDASSKTLLRDLNASIRQLAEAESIRRTSQSRVLESRFSKGLLGRWAAGGGTGGEKSPEQEVEEERLRQGVGGGSSGYKGGKGAAIDEEDRRLTEQLLSPEQLQLFARENQDMLKHYEDTLDQVRTAERSMLEISELQTTLVQNLDIQSANISQLVADSLSTTENVGGGNKELKRATERKSTARMVFWASCGLCGFLITWDLIF